MAHLQHGLGDVDLVVVKVTRESLEVTQHLKTGDAQATGLDGRNGGFQPLRMAHQVARREHDLRETGFPHRLEFGL